MQLSKNIIKIIDIFYYTKMNNSKFELIENKAEFQFQEVQKCFNLNPKDNEIDSINEEKVYFNDPKEKLIPFENLKDEVKDNLDKTEQKISVSEEEKKQIK